MLTLTGTIRATAKLGGGNATATNGSAQAKQNGGSSRLKQLFARKRS